MPLIGVGADFMRGNCTTESPLLRQIGDGHWAASHLNDATGWPEAQGAEPTRRE